MSTTLRSGGTPLSLTLAGIGVSVAAAIALSTLGTTAKPTGIGVPALFTGDHRSALAKASEGFVENLGQWDGQALFLAQSPGVNTWVTENGVVYDFHQTDSPNAQHPTPDTPRAAKRRGHVVRMEFVGGTSSQPRGEALLEGRYNYFKGNDPDKWVTQVPRYAEARSERIYDGIEARWYFDQGRPRYDLIVAPGADPGKIHMRFEGARGVSSNGRALRIGTSLGDVEHRGLFAYQKVDGATRQVSAAFRVSGNTASFEVGNYDRSRPLVIDPIVWGTYLGGSVDELNTRVVLDASGNVVIAGSTSSPDFPVTLGAYDTTFASTDAFLSKLSADGSTLLFSSYLGGTDVDILTDLALLPTGQPVVTGYTASSNFPTGGSGGAYDATPNGSTDVFVTKFSSDGSALSFSTYYGAGQLDFASAISYDAALNVYVSGATFSTNLPMAAPPGFSVFYGGGQDGFVIKLSADGSALMGATYVCVPVSGSNEDAYSMRVLASGQVLVTGLTQAPGFPTTVGAFDTTHNGGDDLYIIKLSSDLTTLDYGTYFGGTAQDQARVIYSPGAGNFIVGGTTRSTSLPGTTGAFDPTYNADDDTFIAVFTDAGVLLNTTYLGGAVSDSVSGVSFDTLGNIIATGSTNSADFPKTPGAFDSVIGGTFDNFLVKLSSNLATLKYSTYVGGSGSDHPQDLVTDNTNHAFVGGTSSASDFPTTAGAYDQTLGGSSDATVYKFNTAPVMHSLQAPKNTFIGGFAIPFDLALNQPAEPGDIIIPITSNNPGKILTTTTKMRVGKQSKNLSVRTETVVADTPVQITATYGGVAKIFNFTLKPGGLQSLKLQPTSLTSMQFGTGTVKISAVAPVDGRTVKLDADKSALVYVPGSVDIEAGQIEAVFPVFAGIIASTSNVTITARLGTMKKTATLTVNP